MIVSDHISLKMAGFANRWMIFLCFNYTEALENCLSLKEEIGLNVYITQAAAETALYSDVQKSIERFPSVLHKGLSVYRCLELLDCRRCASRGDEHVH